MSETKVLFEPGDTVPPLVLVRPERLLPGDRVWGVRDRKNFILDFESWTVGKPPVPHGDYGWNVDGHLFATDGIALVEIRSKAGRSR